ncbi:MAG: hypothetical protein AAF721_10075 [Myxococcota bacterium]
MAMLAVTGVVGCTGHGDARYCDHFAEVMSSSPWTDVERARGICMADIETSKAFHGKGWNAYYRCAMEASDSSQLGACSMKHRQR